MLKRTWKIGKKIEELSVGEKLHITETIEDKDLLLYLGLTNDNNPLYIQHDYTSETPYLKPIVPIIMLNGIITSAISKHLPGPGSLVVEQQITYCQPVFHYETLTFELEIITIDLEQANIMISVYALNSNDEKVLQGCLKVKPPY